MFLNNEIDKERCQNMVEIIKQHQDILLSYVVKKVVFYDKDTFDIILDDNVKW